MVRSFELDLPFRTRTVTRYCSDLHRDSAAGPSAFLEHHAKRCLREVDLSGLYYAKTDGSLIRELVQPMIMPNGVGLSSDEQTVYVAEPVYWSSVGIRHHLARRHRYGAAARERWPPSCGSGRIHLI